jgi:DNA replication protein DnaC
MAQTPTTSEQPDEPQRLGEVVGFDPVGGVCAQDDCDTVAPVVTLFGQTIQLPCDVHQAEKEAAWAEEDRVRLAAAYLATAGLTARQERFTLDTYAEACDDDEGQAALQVARAWLDRYVRGGDAGNLLLYGPIGTGKTGLAAGIVRALCESGRRAQIVNFKALLDEMKDCFDRHQPTAHAFGVGRVPVLVLDDIGAERPTEWARDELLGIVDYRYERGLPTIYVSNYSPGDLTRRLSGKDRGNDGDKDLTVGTRIVSRMRERATGFEFTGRDRRLAA